MGAPRLGTFEFNLNTVLMLIGFASGFVAWGYTLSAMQSGLAENAANIVKHDQRITTLEHDSRRVDQHDFRLGLVERQAVDGATAMRAVESQLSVLTTDVKVVREILQRIEASQNGRKSTPTVR